MAVMFTLVMGSRYRSDIITGAVHCSEMLCHVGVFCSIAMVT